jgi:hypothetical protein
LPGWRSLHLLRTRRDETLKVLSDATIFRVEPARIVYLSPDEVVQAWREWLPAIEAMKTRTPPDEVPYHFYWRWDALASKVERNPDVCWILGISLTDSNRMQGMMLVEIEGRVSLAGRPLVYVDRLCSAPWNYNRSPAPEYKGMGSVLLAWSVAFSEKLGYGGRLGLHSLPDAEGFYHKCGMIDHGIDNAHEDLRYFEFTEEAAARFLHKA